MRSRWWRRGHLTKRQNTRRGKKEGKVGLKSSAGNLVNVRWRWAVSKRRLALRDIKDGEKNFLMTDNNGN